STTRECRFRFLVRNSVRQGLMLGLIAGAIVASYLVVPLLFVTVSGAVETRSMQTSDPATPRFVLIRRSVAQDQGAWIIDYQLRQTGPTGVILSRSEIGSVIEGWVSN